MLWTPREIPGHFKVGLARLPSSFGIPLRMRSQASAAAAAAAAAATALSMSEAVSNFPHWLSEFLAALQSQSQSLRLSQHTLSSGAANLAAFLVLPLAAAVIEVSSAECLKDGTRHVSRTSDWKM